MTFVSFVKSVRRLVVAAGALIAAAPVAAQDIYIENSALCADLQQQYVALNRQGRGQSGREMVNQEALSRQLAQAQSAARQGNCNRFLFFGPRPSPQCPAINAEIGRIRQQIAQARRGGGGFFARSPDMERARLRDWMDQYGCSVPSLGGTRTVCVRTCDGYPFPISFSASRSQFPRDEQVCQSMYAEPGRAELFSYDGHDMMTAVSLNGKRYKDQYYAFLYRDHFSPTCQDQLKDGIAALGARYWAANPERQRVMLDFGGGKITPVGASPDPLASEAPSVPMPNLLPRDLQEDPETIANRAGDYVPAPYAPAIEQVVATVGPSMRQIGDAYYYDLYDPAKPPPPVETHRGPLGFDLIGSAMAAEGGAALPPANVAAEIAQPPT